MTARLLLGALLLTGLVAACRGGDGHGRLLAAMPETALVAPGASPLGAGDAGDGSPGFGAYDSAIWIRRFCAGGDPGEVPAWYERELARRGWQQSGPHLTPTDDSRLSRGWTKGVTFANLRFSDPTDPRNECPAGSVPFEVWLRDDGPHP